MTEPPALCVADANILIDLHNGGLLELMLALPYRCMIPDLVLEEMHTPSAGRLLALGFQVGGLEPEGVAEVYALRAEHVSLSVPDLFALTLARDRGAILLTGDGRLRDLAKRRALVVHGVLWVLDEMVGHALLTSQGACQALDVIRLKGARLPDAACARMKRRWLER